MKKPKIHPHICVYCHKVYLSKLPDRGKYCGKTCEFNYHLKSPAFRARMLKRHLKLVELASGNEYNKENYPYDGD